MKTHRAVLLGWGILVAAGGLLEVGCGDAGETTMGRRRTSSSSSSGGSGEETDGGAGSQTGDTNVQNVPANAGLPCDIAKLLETKCMACHGETPTPGAQSSLVTIGDLLAPAKSDPTKNEATVSLARMKSTASPMPPTAYSNPVTPDELKSFEAWMAASYQGSCADKTSSSGGNNTPPANLTCTSCHGDPTRAAVTGADPQLIAAPPRNTKGETATTAKGVGAHQAHLTKGSMSKLIACTECHVVPTSTSHSNGVVGLTFGTLAKTGNKTPAFDGTSCSASYCHGNFVGGNTAAQPAWTTGAAMTCTSCHDAPPATGDHKRGAHQFACSNCHGNGFTATTVDKALHINGVKNVGGAGSKINTYNAATRACSPSCHGTETW